MPSQINIPCQKPWQSLLIFADGGARFCCFMTEDLGNLNFQTFKGIWNGPKARRIRKQLLDSKIPQECRFCPLVNQYDLVTRKVKI